jgi:hypothetical protein
MINQFNQVFSRLFGVTPLPDYLDLISHLAATGRANPPNPRAAG